LPKLFLPRTASWPRGHRRIWDSHERITSWLLVATLGLRPRNGAEIRTVEILFADYGRVPLTPSPSPARGEGGRVTASAGEGGRASASALLAREDAERGSPPLSPCGRGGGGEGVGQSSTPGRAKALPKDASCLKERARFCVARAGAKRFFKHPEFPSRRSLAVISSARLPDWQGIARFQDDKRRNETARRPL
jgi:hypothetical protein